MRPSKTYKTIKKETASGVPENLRNCSVCGKVFIVQNDERVCRECLKKEEADRNRLMDYVRDNPGVSIKKAIADTGLPDRLVKRMVLEGMFTNESERIVTKASRVCAICGAPVGGTGIYCRACAARLQRETKQMSDQIIDTKTQKKRGELSVIDKLNAQAERELELERLQRQLQSKR